MVNSWEIIRFSWAMFQFDCSVWHHRSIPPARMLWCHLCTWHPRSVAESVSLMLSLKKNRKNLCHLILMVKLWSHSRAFARPEETILGFHANDATDSTSRYLSSSQKSWRKKWVNTNDVPSKEGMFACEKWMYQLEKDIYLSTPG